MAVPKPTILEYNKVYEGLREASKPLFDKLRTWILDQTGSGGTVDPVTYVDFITLVNSSTLVPGTWYSITDFRSRQEIPNTIGPEINLGPVEVIFVMAVTNVSIHEFCLSGTFAQDLMMYDPLNTDFGADMGRIIYRRDMEANLEAWFDWRFFLYRRWEDAGGSLVVLTDNGNASSDMESFGTDCFNCSIAPTYVGGARIQSNNIMGLECVNVEIMDNCTDNTIVSECQNIRFAEGGGFHVVFDNCANIDIGKRTFSITVDAGQTDLTVGKDCDSIHFAGGCSTITIGDFTTASQFESTRFANIGSGCNALFFLTQPSFNAIQGVTMGNLNGSHTLDATTGTISGLTFMDNVNSSIVSGPAGNITQQAGSQGYNFTPLTADAQIKASSGEMEMALVWDFATNGGAVGTYNLIELPLGCSGYFAALQVVTPLVSATTTNLALGVETDDPQAWLAPTSSLDPAFSGVVTLLAAGFIPASGTLLADRNIQFEILNDALTAGRIVFWIRTFKNSLT